MYSITKWVDRAVEFPNRFRETQDGSGFIMHTREPGKVLTEGTPYCAENMNNMEDGIAAAYLLAATVAAAYGVEIPALKELTREEFTPEIHEITLKNTERFPFNNSQQTIAMTTKRRTLNYTVEAEIKGGAQNVGEVRISDKLQNGFKVSYEGSAASAVIRLVIKGGMKV